MGTTVALLYMLILLLTSCSHNPTPPHKRTITKKNSEPIKNTISQEELQKHIQELDNKTRYKLVTQKWSPDFHETKLEEILNQMQSESNINLNALWGSLEFAGILKEELVTLKLNDVSYETTLNTLLQKVSVGKGIMAAYTIHRGIVTIAIDSELPTYATEKDYPPRGEGFGGGGGGPIIEQKDNIEKGLSGNKPRKKKLGDIPITGRNNLSLFGLTKRPSASSSPNDNFLKNILHISADEIWVITRPTSNQLTPLDDNLKCGTILATIPKITEEIPLPLKHTNVNAQVSGYIGSVNVQQQFHNPYNVKIEAKYVFPLPQNAAVNEFIMTIGDRKIRGIIREKEEAEKIYKEAKIQGYTASLLTQQRPNIFTQKVANIEPNKDIDIDIKYFNTLAYNDGWYEFVFPMVVGPRYNPPNSTNGIGAVSQDQQAGSGQTTEVAYLKPNQRSGHDISLTLNIDAGVKIEASKCHSHVIEKEVISDKQILVKLSPNDTIPNKDFIFRYKVAGDKLKPSIITHNNDTGNYFTMMLYPPENLSSLKRAPVEMIFVLDCSGSMNGFPLQKSKEAITRALKKLQPQDTFQVIRFSSDTSQLGNKPVIATKENIDHALEFVNNLHGSGGTHMIEGIKAALDFEHDASRMRIVTFMTDGYIGNEVEILGEIHKRLGEAKIFSFGIGDSVNRYLLDRMAKLGKGAVAYIGLNENAIDTVDLFYDRISHPALTNINIDWGNLKVTDVYPRQVPDLFVGRPVILTGRINGKIDETIKISGNVGPLDHEILLDVDLNNNSHKAVSSIWARKKIEDLSNQATYDKNNTLPEEIKNVALSHGLMSNYTAFIAVDSLTKTAGTQGITVNVPVPVPSGVNYETTVNN